MKINIVQLLCCKKRMRPVGLSVFSVGLVLLFSINFTAQISNPGKSAPSVDSFNSDTVKKQTAKGELPPSRVYEFIKPEASKTTRLSKLSEEQKKSSSTMEKKLQIGTVRQLEQPISQVSQGTVYSIARGTVWISEIISEDAVQTRLRFNETDLPPGAKLFVYSAKNPDDVYGPYEKRGESDTGDFWTPPFEGDGVIVEYFVPNQNELAEDKLPFRITEVAHIYRNPLKFGNEGMNDPAEYPCHNEVPAEWSFVAKSVGQFQYVDDEARQVYDCTGTLLSSLAGDFDPIFLTANHCVSSAAEAQSMIIYWFYNSGDYPALSFPSLPRSVGATLLNTKTSQEASDFTLLRIRGAIPMKSGIVFSGWDPTPITSVTSVVGIHHPNGSHKRFSSGIINSAAGNFLGVRWNSGITERGSSGSGLWKGSGANARLIGTLYDGSFGCINSQDNYGKFSVTYPYIASNLQGGSDDAYDAGSGNDLRANAVGIGQGLISNLIVKYADSDWYSVTVPAGFRITATANFTHNYGDINLALYRGNETTPVSISESATGTETVTHTATGGSTIYYLNVSLFDGARNDYTLNVTLQSGSTGVRRALFDYDGDGRADVSVYRPSNGIWYLFNSSTGFTTIPFGISTDKIVPADYDGDGKTDVAVWREDPSNPNRANFYIFNSSTATNRIEQFGQTGDSPLAGDWDGDGRADPTVYRNGANGGQSYFFYRPSSQPGKDFVSVPWGIANDKPVIADYDGDGKTDAAVFRPSNRVWYMLQSTKGYSAIQFGISTDKPVVGDYDGDGKADQAVYRAGISTWYIQKSTTGFAAEEFGISSDLPVPADYDGDGKTDIAVFRLSNNTWYQRRSTLGFGSPQFGLANDKLSPNAFIP